MENHSCANGYEDLPDVYFKQTAQTKPDWQVLTIDEVSVNKISVADTGIEVPMECIFETMEETPVPSNMSHLSMVKDSNAEKGITIIYQVYITF